MMTTSKDVESGQAVGQKAKEPGSEPRSKADAPSMKLSSEFLHQFSELIQAEELRHYREHQDRIRAAFEKRIPALVSSVAQEARSLRVAAGHAELKRRELRKSYLYLIPLALIALASVFVAVISIIGDFRNVNVFVKLPSLSASATLQATQRTWFAISLIVAVAVTIPSLRYLVRKQEAEENAAIARALAENRLSSSIRTSANEALHKTINEVLQGSGILLFPTAAPTLVELTSHNIIHSSTQDYVRDFILSHQSAAIGIAGPRGSGKSTLMRAINDDTEIAHHSLLLNAPVKYDPVDFTRRLFLQSAREILKKESIDHTPFEDRQTRERRRVDRVARTRLQGAFTAAIVGLVIFSLDFVGSGRFLEIRISPLGVLGATIGIYGAGLLYYTLLTRLVRRPRNDIQPSVLIAWEADRDLTWDVEQGQKSKNILKIAGGLFGLEDEDSVTFKRRSLAHPDLVAEFREMLMQFSREQPEARFVILVDELDKLSSREELINAVNGLKDLFHIPGVHFVVSVSTDALANFEQRGVPTRDAFDSAFDTIIRFERLSLQESVEVISSRAAGFPRVLSFFCHAWSGGLPRDLLRAARRCVEFQRRNPQAVPVVDIIQAIILTDLEIYLESTSRAIDAKSNGATQLIRMMQDIRCLVDKNEAPSSVLSNLGVYTSDDINLDRARALLKIGVGLIGYFSRILQDQSDWDNPGDDVRKVVAKFANAVSMQGELAELRDAAIDEAMTEARVTV